MTSARLPACRELSATPLISSLLVLWRRLAEIDAVPADAGKHRLQVAEVGPGAGIVTPASGKGVHARGVVEYGPGNRAGPVMRLQEAPDGLVSGDISGRRGGAICRLVRKMDG